MPKMLLPLLLAILFSFSTDAFAQAGGGAGGSRELALGQEAYGRRDFQGAVAHLSRAVQGLGGEREALAEAYLRLGMAYLVGLGSPAQALPAFLSSAELAADPATACLWAATAAKKLGQPDVAERLEARALSGPAPAGEARAEAPAPVTAPAPAEAPAAAPARPETPARAETPARVEAPAPRPEAEKTEEVKPAGKGDAFQYFFGKGRKKGETEKDGAKEAPAAEPPPAG